jgi:hypothetical protein
MVLSGQNCSRSIRLCRLYQSDSSHQRPFSGSGWHNPEVGIVQIGLNRSAVGSDGGGLKKEAAQSARQRD